MSEEVNYTYIVECKDGSLYTGWTNDIIERLHKHNAGTGAKYTRSRRPVKLVFLETHRTKSEAMRREASIKKMSRTDKLLLINEGKSETTTNYSNVRKSSKEEI